MPSRPFLQISAGLLALATAFASTVAAQDNNSRRGRSSTPSAGATPRSAPSPRPAITRPNVQQPTVAPNTSRPAMTPNISRPAVTPNTARPVVTPNTARPSLSLPSQRPQAPAVRSSIPAPRPSAPAVTPSTPTARPQLTLPQNSGSGRPATPPTALPQVRDRLETIRGQNPAGGRPTPSAPATPSIPSNPGATTPTPRPSNPGVRPSFPNLNPGQATPGQNTPRPGTPGTSGPGTGTPGSTRPDRDGRGGFDRNLTPGVRPTLPGTPATPGTGGNSGSATDRLRDRFQQQIEGTRPGDSRRPNLTPGTGAPAGNTPSTGNADNGGDRSNSGLTAPGRDRRPSLEGATPNLPNLDNARDRLRDREATPGVTRPGAAQPGATLPGGTEIERIRDRVRGQTPSEDGDRRTPNLPGLGGRRDGNQTENPGQRINTDRREGDRSNWRIEPQRFDRERAGRVDLAERIRNSDRVDVERIRNTDELRQRLDRFQNNTEVREMLNRSNLRVTDLSGAFQTRVSDRNAFQNISQTNIGRQFNINQQFNMLSTGDVSRRMNLNQQLMRNGGWSKRAMGPVYANYTSIHFSAWYPGPSWYPRYCWTPIWRPWVRWSFWDFCRPVYDPRPFIVRPIYYYDPCPPIVYYNFPVWQPLPVVASGTWVDVPTSVVPQGYDLQLLAVRFVDPGHPEENLGPRYRVWVRNNSNLPVQSPFNVMLVAGNSQQLIAGTPQAGVTIDAMEPNAVVPVDIRLPMEANIMNRTANGQRMPFTTLHVLVDSHQELQELDETNNGLIIDRGEVLPVDPAAFATEEPTSFPGAMVTLAGEGFGPEPGQLVVISGNREFPAEVHGWYDLGVHFKMPNLPVNATNTAQILVIRGDGAVSNPVTVSINGGL